MTRTKPEQHNFGPILNWSVSQRSNNKLIKVGYLDGVGITKLEELWAELQATVNVEGASHEAVFSAWQTIAEFIQVNTISIINAVS